MCIEIRIKVCICWDESILNTICVILKKKVLLNVKVEDRNS